MTETPNDAFFRQVFSDPVNAWDLLRGVLPPELLAAVDEATLAEQETDFVDPELRPSAADVLFRATFRGAPADECLFLLIEHQSTAPPLMAFRVLAYVVRIWERWLRERRERRDLPAPTQLPLVVPVVVHQGPGRWPAARSVGELLEVPEALRAIVAPFVPELHLLLDDLGDAPRSEVLARPGSDVVIVALAILQAVRSGDVLAALLEAAPRLRRILGSPGGSQRLGEVVRYIELATAVDEAALGRALEGAVGREGGRMGMTTGQRLIEQGRAEEARAWTLDLLQVRFGPVPEAMRALIGAASPDSLRALRPRLFTASSIDEALAPLADEPRAGDGA